MANITSKVCHQVELSGDIIKVTVRIFGWLADHRGQGVVLSLPLCRDLRRWKRRWRLCIKMNHLLARLVLFLRSI